MPKQLVMIAAVVAGAYAVTIGAQTPSELAVSEADGFMGDWSVVMQTPQGEATVMLALDDVGGKVLATVTNDLAGSVNVSDVSRTGDSLILRYNADMQGQPLAVSATLTPAGADLNVSFDFGGQFTMEGKGVAQ